MLITTINPYAHLGRVHNDGVNYVLDKFFELKEEPQNLEETVFLLTLDFASEFIWDEPKYSPKAILHFERLVVSLRVDVQPYVDKEIERARKGENFQEVKNLRTLIARSGRGDEGVEDYIPNLLAQLREFESRLLSKYDDNLRIALLGTSIAIASAENYLLFAKKKKEKKDVKEEAKKAKDVIKQDVDGAVAGAIGGLSDGSPEGVVMGGILGGIGGSAVGVLRSGDK